MAFASGSNAKVYLGAYNITTYCRHWTGRRSKNLIDTSTYGDGSRDFIDGLKESGSVILSGLFEPSDDTQDEQISSLFTASSATTPLSLAPSGDTTGNIAYVCAPWAVKYSPDLSLDDLVLWSADLTPNDGLLRGHWLRPLSTTASGFLTASVDNGAASSLGGRFNIHITAIDIGAAGITINLQDSDDQAAWVNVAGGNLLIEGPSTSPTSSSLNITGQIRRYARVDTSTNQVNSITCALALGRRN